MTPKMYVYYHIEMIIEIQLFKGMSQITPWGTFHFMQL